MLFVVRLADIQISPSFVKNGREKKPLLG